VRRLYKSLRVKGLTQRKDTAVQIVKVAQWVPEPVWVLLGRENPTALAGRRTTILLLLRR
jgi:hypothetical protein